ncbi:DUF6673 family protein [Caldifermentibacillus hisashii]|uniref:DUF6673 family protein n=1 Tax=Caldifermentibacillus hisashii TaxID=996558 RepID=UPI0031B7063F
MAIKIQTQKPEIPVEIGDLKFSFNVSDESIKKFRNEAIKVQKELEEIAISDNDDQALEQAKEALKRGFEIMLGEGSFKKIYDISPSLVLCMQYFVQIAIGIDEELKNMGFSQSQKDLAKKYLAQKK